MSYLSIIEDDKKGFKNHKYIHTKNTINL